MKIILFAAGGSIGRRIAREATDRGHEVTAAVRDPARFEPFQGIARVVQADATDAASVAASAQGADAILSAVGPNANGQAADVLVEAARSLVAGARKAGVKRLIALGGAGSLEVAPGLAAVDTPQFPAEWKPNALAQRDALEVYRSEAADLDWTYISPAAIIAPGERTGHYRVGFEQMLFDEKGESRISIEDYAVAMIDELEKAKHIRKRITVTY
ncbi:3-beta hydroxysteroid dehydrogenase [Mesorhizobium amorphae]|uniref:NAD(P)-dependent oxidoreductase n=1 Tax=Mesorhizobium amorphae TaxID=71433 RepID=UPI00235C7431|nr:NAD(P)-dependent oxidoreductase [Mesorhizobium amorphae]GLR46121.1 3-beta hydroxysteroid dehydrogenase [Mesorhizobium amorphae]